MSSNMYRVNFEPKDAVRISALEGIGIGTEQALRILRALDLCDNECSLVFSKTESPIERMFLSAFIAINNFSASVCESGPVVGCVLTCDQFESKAAIFPQVEIETDIGSFRVDFVICGSGKGLFKSIVVETDGHDFHEKTKQQVESDNKRARALLRDGFQIVRFSGSEVFKDPSSCANEAFDCLRAQPVSPAINENALLFTLMGTEANRCADFLEEWDSIEAAPDCTVTQ